MKDHALVQGEIITREQKYIDKILKNTELILSKLGTKHPWVKGIFKFVQMKGPPHPFSRGDNRNSEMTFTKS